MAIWQFSLHIVSRKDIESKYQSIPEIIGSDDVELLTGWEQNLPLNNIYSALNRELPEGKSWSKDIKIWGDVQSHCIELLFDNGRLDELSIRIDLRDYKDSIVDLIMELSKELGGILLINNRLFRPDPKVLLKEIKKSSADKFLENPTKYLNDLDDK